MLIPQDKSRPHLWRFAGIVVLIGILGFFASTYVYTKVDSAGRLHILDRAATMAEGVDAETLATFTGTEADLENEDYQRTKSLLMRMRAANSDARFLYLIGKNEANELFFYADSEDPSSPDYSPPGQVYYEATPAMQAFFEDGKPVTEGPDQDRWGVWISGYAPVHDAEGNIIAMLGMDLPAEQYLRDVSTYSALPLLFAFAVILLLALNLRARLRELRYVEQKSELLAIASHEVRTPLTGMRWALERTLEGKNGELPVDAARVLGQVHESSLRLITRINNLLDMNALSARGKYAFHKEHVLVKPLIDDVVQSLTLSASQRNVRIVAEVPRDASVPADRQMLQHALFNLLANAVKYTKEGTEVTVRYAERAKEHRFEVIDHGNGISEAEKTRIFEGYHRTKDAVHSGQTGTGLGLYLTKRAAELHGGRVEATSTPGAGATFTFVIPV